MPSAEARSGIYPEPARRSDGAIPHVWRPGRPAARNCSNAALKGRPCFAGLDLGATRDMTALCSCFAGDDSGFDVVPFCWLPGETFPSARTRTGCPIGYGRSKAFTDLRRQDHRPASGGASKLPSCTASMTSRRWRSTDGRCSTCSANLTPSAATVPMVAWGQGYKDMGFCRRCAREAGRGRQAAARQSSGAAICARPTRRSKRTR